MKTARGRSWRGNFLPRGRGLPAEDWERRHRGLLAILWLHVVAVPLFGIAQGYDVLHSILEGAVLLAAALVAQVAPISRRLRSAAMCIGLLTASGLLVHFSGGYIEFHFHFFVMIALLALYVDWFPFLLAVGYVLVHHGLVGVLDSAEVYNHPDAVAHPWKWAGIHAAFVLAAGAASIFTWRVVEDEARRRENIALVTEAALAKLPLGELLDVLLARISEVVDADVATIWMREHGDLVLKSVHGVEEETARRVRLTLAEGFHGRIVATQRPLVETDVDPDTLLSPIHRSTGARAIAGVPLLVEGDLLGILDVASVRARQFSSTDLELLQLVADRIAPAIDRARLYEQEHQIATTLQQGLLPKRLPDVQGLDLVARYLPAGDQLSVGGDWYDAMELPGGRLALAMGDVAGHGSEAAALMGQLRTGLRAYATDGHSPEEVMSRLNALLIDLDGDSMATLLYLELDVVTWRGRLISAGHPPPVLLEADGNCRFVEGSRSAPLGAVPFTAFKADPLELGEDATLVFYTDGLVERRNVPIDSELEELLERVASRQGESAEAICCALIDAAVGNGALNDDVAVLTVQRTPVEQAAFEVILPASPSAIPAVRRQIEHFLRTVGADEQESYEIVTSTCEACANAVQHAYAGRDAEFTLSAVLDDGAIRVCVEDAGSWRTPVITEIGGRGLLMMRALMDDVSVEQSSEGTRVTLSRKLSRVGPGAVELA